MSDRELAAAVTRAKAALKDPGLKNYGAGVDGKLARAALDLGLAIAAHLLAKEPTS